LVRILKIAKNEYTCAVGDDPLDNESERGRVTVWVGDLTKPAFGLSPSAYQILAQNVGRIYHCGAEVNWLKSYDALRAPNVEGTLHVLKLASTDRLKPVHYISTIGVTNGNENTMWPQEQLHLLSGYSLSKWVGEYFVKQAAVRGVPTVCYRPGMITAHSSTGASNPDDFINRYICGIVDMGAYIDEPGLQDMTPVDFVSAAIVELSIQQPPFHGHTFHLVNPQPITFRHLGELVAAQGYPLEPLPYQEWRKRFLSTTTTTTADNETNSQSQSKQNRLFSLLPYFSEDYGEQINRQPAFQCGDTLAILAKIQTGASPEKGITCPTITSNLLHVYVQSLQQRGLL